MAIGGVVLQFSADTAKARRDIDKLTRSLKGVSDTEGTMGKLGKLGKAGLLAVGAGAAAGVYGLARLATAAITTAADFEQSQNILQASLGATGADMEKLSDLAKQLGTSTSFSAMDASNAMIELAKAGLSTKQIMGGAVAASMALAATEGMALADAATTIANTMAQFGIKAKDAATVADILAAGSVASTASVESLAEGLKYVGSTASGLGVPLSDVVTALAALEQAGLGGSMGGTSLNEYMTRLVKQTPKAAAEMERLGLSFIDANGEMLPINESLALLAAELDGMGSAERQRVLTTIFGERGRRAAQNLLQLGTEGWAALNQQILQTGVAAEMADARTKGFWGAIERLQGAWETLKITLGTPLMEVMTGWINQVTEYLESPEGQKWIKTLETQVATFAANIKLWVETTLLPALQSIYTWFTNPENKTAAAGFAADLGTVAGAFQMVADSVRAIGDAFTWLLTSWDKLPGPLKSFAKFAVAPGAKVYGDVMPSGGRSPASLYEQMNPGAQTSVTVNVTPGYYSTAEKVRVTKVYGGRAVV
jgi:TP901 family phage tail tape measure protein